MRFFIFLMAFSIFGTACQNNAPAPAESKHNPSTTTAAPEVATEQPRKNIVFFGNSLTAAFGLEPEQGFPALIQQKIDAENLPYHCVNAGLSGETTAGGLKRVEWILQQKVDVFVLELGGNDALRGLPVAASKQNLEQIIDLVRAKYPDCKILLAGMQAPPNLGAAYAAAFQGMYPAISKEKKVALLPFLLEGVGGEAALNQTDGIHPTAEGQKKVAENVWSALRPLL